MCKPLSEGELDKIAHRVVAKLKEEGLTSDEVATVQAVIRTKKWAVRMVLYAAGVMTIWILKDIYLWLHDLVSHLRILKVG